MDNDHIIFICQLIHNSPNMVSSEITEFKEKYPKLYNYVQNENYDEEFLKLLLGYRNKVDNDVIGTDMIVSEHIADKFLYNNDTLKRPNENVMQHFRDKIRRMNPSNS